MSNKGTDPEAPSSTSSHLESLSKEKQDEKVAQDWTRDVAEKTQDPKSFEKLDELSEGKKKLLRREKIPWMEPAIYDALYDHTLRWFGNRPRFYFAEFNVTNTWQQGLLNGAPYLCSALIGCWTTAPVNRSFGHRGCIFISCFISFASSFWMAAAHTWWNLLLGQFLFGFAVGAKSATTPVYGAECTATIIRGALVTMWQMWTVFGIMLGYIVSVAFMDVTHPTIPGSNWRLMLGSTTIPRVHHRHVRSAESPTVHFSTHEPVLALHRLFILYPDDTSRTACVATGIYLFMVVYSPGEGPVPFTYSAEAFPLYIRDVGKPFATATTWGFNFIVSLTPQGTSGWYAPWNIFGWIFCYFCLPETKALSLEELDQLFSVPTTKHAKHYAGMLPWYVKKYILRGDVPPQKQLYDYE
ncbi:uncharacterized protein BO80DRAFT_449648 [Aspergillus ibericus CBS 121593]|uniref:MFS general substrate transporter n=1 Tax=Aspergillus ibericus CBS 121593 TaxID=1448316 RepID=A0A395GKM6_9EURO|nr:hypothetical protein BO80DRAFT_449648 [Aspergillus ibericus CBS 121593]RAK96051.1 hypothetical protein BO80DRAFT_449648 [Aspergillus ibericus CBS 121593]